MRLVALIPLVLLAPLASSQEVSPLLEPEGTSLDDFRVVARLVQVDHATAEGLAASFARLLTGEARVARRFAEAFEDAHLAVLKDFYSDEMVRAQRDAYAELRTGRGVELAARVLDVVPGETEDTAHALLVRRTHDARTRAETERRVRLDLERRKGLWWVTRVLEEAGDPAPEDQEPTWVERPFTTPPVLPPELEVPAAKAPDRATAEGLVTSLRTAMRRLARARLRAQRELYRHHLGIVGAFFGEETLNRAKESVRQLEPRPPLRFDIEATREQVDRVRRVAVTVVEPVPDEQGVVSPVGQSFFDLSPAEGGWRIVGELVRPTPAEQPRPSKDGFGLLLAVP